MHVESNDPLVLTRILEPDISLAVWQQQVTCLPYVEALLALPWKLNLKSCLPLRGLEAKLAEDLPDLLERRVFVDQVAELSEMFACLFDLDQVGLRLQVLDQPMCPRFHVDRVLCRLSATFVGPGTQWLSHQQVNRDKLGHQHPAEDQLEGQLFAAGTQIQQLKAGEVGLMKGSLWEGQDNLGLVHRSPSLAAGQRRLLLTLDLM
ncbi:DUF1826 domain-containing protein [Marinospirillum sp.]|uniref:DUF1826 domain-containing protein n=1 Tax=Marinospirillum sp. TaxID=2183934 RepID=UPI003A86A990